MHHLVGRGLVRPNPGPDPRGSRSVALVVDRASGWGKDSFTFRYPQQPRRCSGKGRTAVGEG